MTKPLSKRFYFVDEAGDGVLFDGRGRLQVGKEGCSRYFMLGMLDLPALDELTGEFTALRANLLADPYFKKVPSMQPEARKTALLFHAKDDLPEVRREVLGILRQKDYRFFAAVRDKLAVVSYAIQRREREPGYRYHPNELYDYLVRSLFKGLLHKDDHYEVYFAKRGAHDRTETLNTALKVARERAAQQWGVKNDPLVQVSPQIAEQNVGLQAADYFLWALQRFYERREDRYLELLWPQFSLVHDLDDKRARYGAYYTQKGPLTLAALENGLPGI